MSREVAEDQALLLVAEPQPDLDIPSFLIGCQAGNLSPDTYLTYRNGFLAFRKWLDAR